MSRIDRTNVQILLVEMQPPMVASVRTLAHDVLRRSASAVLRLARTLEIPLLASGLPIGAEPPAPIGELASLPLAIRKTITPFGDDDQRARLRDAGRRILAVGGVSSEIAIVNTVLDACGEGFDVHVLLDCCGGLDDRAEAAALRQMERAGAIPSSVSTFFTSMVDDMTSSEGAAVMKAMAERWEWQVA